MKRILTILAATLIAGGALAQSAWPSKPVKLIVPFTAGSITDIMARTISEAMSKSLGWDPLESTCRHASLSIL